MHTITGGLRKVLLVAGDQNIRSCGDGSIEIDPVLRVRQTDRGDLRLYQNRAPTYRLDQADQGRLGICKAGRRATARYSRKIARERIN